MPKRQDELPTGIVGELPVHYSLTLRLVIFWATPTMTIAHLIFALGTTAYILFAIQLEEHDLVTAFGDDYVEYRSRTPMLVPRLWRRRPQPVSDSSWT